MEVLYRSQASVCGCDVTRFFICFSLYQSVNSICGYQGRVSEDRVFKTFLVVSDFQTR